MFFFCQGKTTTATLVSKDLGFDIVEFNASDTRSKRLLHEEVSQLLSTTTIAGFAGGNPKSDLKDLSFLKNILTFKVKKQLTKKEFY